MTPARVGVIGCGNILEQYIQGMRAAGGLEIVACADLDVGRAAAAAARHGIPASLPAEQLIADPSVDIVVNLTVPAAHADVTSAALGAGRSVYSEKPLGVTLAECDRLIALADRHRVRLGSAPDTFLGAGTQTARQAIDAGLIGRPVSASAQLLRPGPEAWHPSPEFIYAHGAGPVLDIGPYYVTALVTLLGAVDRVTALGTNPMPARRIGAGPRAGQTFRSVVDTDVRALMEMGSVAVALTLTYDSPELGWRVEIVGDEGVIRCGDPDTFEGPVLLRRYDEATWRELPLLAEGTAHGRGFGVAELATAIAEGRPHRTNATLARHVMETLLAVEQAARSHEWVAISSRCERPAPLPIAAVTVQ
jgi:predicted dehydrogenase